MEGDNNSSSDSSNDDDKGKVVLRSYWKLKLKKLFNIVEVSDNQREVFITQMIIKNNNKWKKLIITPKAFL